MVIDILEKYYIPEKASFILIKTLFFEIDRKEVFLELV